MIVLCKGGPGGPVADAGRRCATYDQRQGHSAWLLQRHQGHSVRPSHGLQACHTQRQQRRFGSSRGMWLALFVLSNPLRWIRLHTVYEIFTPSPVLAKVVWLGEFGLDKTFLYHHLLSLYSRLKLSYYLVN